MEERQRPPAKILQAAKALPAALAGHCRPLARAAKGWVGRHRPAALLLAAVLAALGGWGWLHSRPGAAPAAAYSFIRTTVLQRGSLENSVSATGTVASGEVSQVTTNLKYAVKEVFVQVGDRVQAGDVICTLDTQTLENQIQRRQQAVDEAVEAAQRSCEKAEKTYTEAVEDKEEAWQSWQDAQAEYDDAHTRYYDAQASVGSIQEKYLNAQAALENALELYNSYLKALGSYGEGGNENSDLGEGSYTEVVRRYCEASLLYEGSAPSIPNFASDTLSTAYDRENCLSAQWQAAQTTMDLTALKQAYSAADSAREAAEAAYETACDRVDDAREQLDNARKTLENAGEDNELSDLRDELGECTLRAQTAGTVTALGAAVGAACEGSAATIQDTENLLVSISISENDIHEVALDMACKISTDAVGEVIPGRLTQLSPTAGQNGAFEAQVQVEGGSQGLLIGMNANVEIVQNTVEDVFTVPLDAVGQDEVGSFVYQQTGGEGLEAVFEKLYVTTGESNDYYVEIQGEALREGMVIRSSADLTQGLETVEDSTGEGAGLGPGEDGMPGGDVYFSYSTEGEAGPGGDIEVSGAGGAAAGPGGPGGFGGR